jgi:hypothetical protein
MRLVKKKRKSYRAACGKQVAGGSRRQVSALLPEIPVSYTKTSLFEKKRVMDRKKLEFMIAGIEQICIFVAVKKRRGAKSACRY